MLRMVLYSMHHQFIPCLVVCADALPMSMMLSIDGAEVPDHVVTKASSSKHDLLNNNNVNLLHLCCAWIPEPLLPTSLSLYPHGSISIPLLSGPLSLLLCSLSLFLSQLSPGCMMPASSCAWIRMHMRTHSCSPTCEAEWSESSKMTAYYSLQRSQGGGLSFSGGICRWQNLPAEQAVSADHQRACSRV